MCYEGRSAGVLFKPCLCDGSVKYIRSAGVHSRVLDAEQVRREHSILHGAETRLVREVGTK